ncbi:MAG: chemotaxis protein CheW [Gammaproteobacteria bacterium]|jgi:twitching motility protein PilI
MNTRSAMDTAPLATLRSIEEACRLCSAGLSAEVETASEWSGIAFRIGASNLVTPLEEVAEILEYPEVSAVPGTQPWVHGIANIRGNLLTVVDLGAYLGADMTALTNRCRLLVVDHNGVCSGLLVDEVSGLKHFMHAEFCEDDICTAGFLHPFVRHGFRRGESCWGLFSLHALADAPQFLRVAV